MSLQRHGKVLTAVHSHQTTSIEAAVLSTARSGVRILVRATSRSALGPTSLLFNGYRASSPGIRRPGHDVNHSPPSSTEAKNEWSYASTPPVRLRDVDSKHFTFFTSSFCRYKITTWRLHTKCFTVRSGSNMRRTTDTLQVITTVRNRSLH